MKWKTKQIIAGVLAAITILCTVIEPLPVYADAEGSAIEAVATAEPETTETPVESVAPVSTEPVSTEAAVETVIPEPGTAESPVPEETAAPEPENGDIDRFLVLMPEENVSEMSTVITAGISAQMNLGKGISIPYPSDLGGSYSTHYYTLNGQTAYCMEPDQGVPTPGSYDLQEKNDPNAIRALLYGYGGNKQSVMEKWLSDNGISTDVNTMYVYTHIAVSYYYSTDYEKAFTGVSGWWNSKAYEWIEYIRDNADMPLTFSSSSGKASVTPTYPQVMLNGKYLKTEDFWPHGTIWTTWTGAMWTMNYMGAYPLTWSWDENNNPFTASDDPAKHMKAIFYLGNIYPVDIAATEEAQKNFYTNMFRNNTAYWNYLIAKTHGNVVYSDTYEVPGEGKLHYNRICLHPNGEKDNAKDPLYYIYNETTDTYTYINVNLLNNLVYITNGNAEKFDVKIEGGVTGYTLQYVKAGDTIQDVGTLCSVTTDEGGSEVSFYINFTTGKDIYIKKVSTDGTPLADAQFKVYTDAACTQPLYIVDTSVGNVVERGTVTTGADGLAYVGKVSMYHEKLYIKEEKAPDGYRLDETVHEAVLDDNTYGTTITVTIENEPVNGKLTIYKEGNLISGVTGAAGSLSFTYTTGMIKEKAVFDVYANEELTGGDGTKYPAGTLIYGNLETVDGVASIEGLPVGSYKVVEKFAPANYVVAVTPRYTTMTYNATSDKYEGELTFYNDMQKGTVDIIKADSTTRKTVKGAVIGLYAAEDIVNHEGTVIAAKDTLIQQGTTDAEGRCSFTGLPAVCRFYVKEISASVNYILSSTGENITFVNGKCTVEIENTPQSGILTIYKEGPVLTGFNGTDFIYETKKLPGFTFRVTAAENIYDASGTLVYAKGAVVKEKLVTGSDGSITVTGLPLGTYHVTETVKKEGYNLNTAVHGVTLAYAGQTVEVSEESVTVTNSRQPVKVSVLKEDAETGKGLKGAVIGLYTAENITGCSGTVVAAKDKLIDTVTTDAGGKGVFDVNLPGTFRYYVKEITAPAGYILNETKYYVEPLKNGEVQAAVSVTVPDTEQTGSLTVYKEGEVLTGWNGSDFVYEERKLPGFTFRLTAGADICRGDGTLIFKKGAVVADNLVTGSDGSVTVDNLYLGTYVVQETGTTDGYVIDTAEYTVKLEYKGQNVEVSTNSVTIENDRQTAEFGVYKTDADTKKPLAGGEYTIYAAGDIHNAAGKKIVSADTPLQTITTGTDGKAYFTVDLPVGYRYYVKETKAPYGYVKTDTQKTINFAAMANIESVMPHTAEFSNERVVAAINIQKVDAETGENVPQGDATLAGAVYELRARENIVYPDGSNGIIFLVGEVITHLTVNETTGRIVPTNSVVELKTDEDGKAVAGWTDSSGNFHEEELLLGKYYVKEITAPEGYLIDETEHEIDCSYKDDTTAVIEKIVTSEEQVIKMPFRLTKFGDDGSSLLNPMVGAGFSAYLISDLAITGYDADNKPVYDYNSAEPIILTKNGDTVIYTDENGMCTTIAIPYGSYSVVETYAPEGWLPLTPFTISITTNGEEPDGSLTYFGKDDIFKAFLRIVKKDADTGETVAVPGVQFKIFDIKNNRYYVEEEPTSSGTVVPKEVFITDETGALILRNTLSAGDYRIEEITAPDGYVLNDQYITVKLGTSGVYDVITVNNTNCALITVEYPNAPVTGELTVLKQGETLTGYTAGRETAADGSAIEGRFTYTVNGLAGAKFAVYAAEDIYTADMQTDAEGNRTKYYSEGEYAGEIVTGTDGKGTLTGLPPGTYKVVETEAPDGYVLNDEEQNVTFAYVDENTPVIYESLTFNDTRQKVELTVTKKDADTEKILSGAVFGLYAKEAITNAAGTAVVSVGQLLETAVWQTFPMWTRIPQWLPIMRTGLTQERR